MGLYLCVFDCEEEIDGVDVGSYVDFSEFRQVVFTHVENGVEGSVCPVLIRHSGCDGEWSPEEARALLSELQTIEEVLSVKPPVPYNSEWKSDVQRVFRSKPANMLECFFDVDGELLTERLKQLCLASIERNSPILFQ